MTLTASLELIRPDSIRPRPSTSVPVPTVISAIAGAPRNWAITGLAACARARAG